MFAVGSNTNPTTTLRPSFGFSAGGTQNFCVGFGADNHIVTIGTGEETNAFRRARNGHCLALGSTGAGATAYSQIKVSSFTSDGAHFTYDGNDASTWNLWYMALGGTDITNVKAGQFTLNATTGNQDITDVGFEPDFVFFLGGDSPSPPASGNSTPHLSLFLGAAKNASNEGVMSLSSVDNLTSSTDCAKYQRNDRCIAFFTEGSTSTIDCEAEYVSTVSGGFRINILSAPTNQQPVFYLAIKGGSWNVSSFNAPTSAQSQTVTVPDSHTPKGLFVWGAGKTAGTSAVAGLDYTVGAATSSTAEWSNTGHEVDAATINNSARGSIGGSGATASTVRVLTGASNSLGTSAQADFTSFAANQFTLNWSTTSAATQQLYVTMGDNVGASLKKEINESLNVSDGTPLRTIGRVRLVDEIVNTQEGAPIAKKFLSFSINESLSLTEEIQKYQARIRLVNETVNTQEQIATHAVRPTSTLQSSALHLRYSGGTNNQTTTSSRGGAMSNFSVTDNTMNNAWDDVLSTESTAGRTEFRCFYIYNTSASSTAYNCELWVDSNTPAGDVIEVGVGSAATGGTEQDLTASAETEPPISVSFSTAPDPDSAIPLGNIPALSGRSIWIRRTVPASTPSWSDNQYRLRMSFYADYSEPIATAGFLSQGFLSSGFIT